MNLKDAHHDSTRPKLPDFPSSSSKTTNCNNDSRTPEVEEMTRFLSNSTSNGDETVVYPREPFWSTSVSLHGFNVPMVQPFVAQMSHQSRDSVILSDDDLEDQQYTSETNNHRDSTPITRPPPLSSRKSLERDIAIARELSVSGDFVSNKLFNSPYVLGPPLNSTTDTNTFSPTENSKVEARQKPSMISFFLNLVNYSCCFHRRGPAAPNTTETALAIKAACPRIGQYFVIR